MDLSAPHNSEESSINELIDKDEFSLSYVCIDDAIRQLHLSGKHSKFCKVDISDAFKLLPMDPKLYPFYGFCWENQFYFYTKLTFGCRSSPKIFDQLSIAICWILKNNYRIDFVMHLLDDFLTIDTPSFNSERTMAILSMVFNKLKIPVARHKTTGPCEEIEYLGITLDSVRMEARLPPNKLLRITAIIDSFRNRKSVTKRELLSLLGHINFASRVIVQGRSFTSYLLTLASSAKKLHHHVHFTKECQRDLQMWYSFMNQWNGHSVFLNDVAQLACDIDLYTDAAGSIGFGGYYNGQWFQSRWPSEISLDNSDMSIAYMELYPIVIAAMLWGHRWSGKRIKFHCDNQTTVDIIRKGRSKSANIMTIMRRLTWCNFTNNCFITAVHIPGKLNNIADSLSRFQMERFFNLAPQADRQPRQIPDFNNVPFY